MEANGLKPMLFTDQMAEALIPQYFFLTPLLSLISYR